MIFSSNFTSAATDYLFLLEKKYPQKAVLKLVGDRYALSGVERTMLYRGISDRAVCKLRQKKLWVKPLTSRTVIQVDAYNVLLTVGSYLNGSAVFIGLDGLLRDASEIHGKAFRKELLDRSLRLVLEFLSYSKVKSVFFYLDRPVSHSGELAIKISANIREHGLKGDASVHDSADYILKKTAKGIIATSDSAIIDHSNVSVYDLARKTLEHHFEPGFFDLKQAINSPK